MTQTPEARPRHRLLIGFCLVMVAVFLSLGIWQVQRLAWKTDLIARVEARLAAPPTPAPGPDLWPEMTQAADEYRRVTVTGHYLDHPDTLVLAVTAAGRGSWVMSAFQTAEGWPVLINRGFVPEERRQDYPAPPRGLQQLSGLLRLSQPDGAFLRSNDPAQDRWFSRDTKAIGLARGITGSAPWFLDLDTAPEALPMPGLTVVSFRNPHLGYALTWFAMAATTVALLIIGLRSGRDKNQRSS